MTRLRSPGYPNASLQQAIDVAEKIFNANRQNAVDREAAVRDAGYSGITGASSKMLSDLIHFDLLAKSGKGGVRVTDVAVSILHARADLERMEALRRAAYAPELFSDIRVNWPDGHVSEHALRSYLMRKGFASSAVLPAIRSYFQTYDFLQKAGATESHSDPASADADSQVGGDNPMPPAHSPEAPPNLGPSLIRGVPLGGGVALMAGERIVFVEESGPSRYLKLVASGDMDADLLEALEDYVKRQKKRLERSASAVSVSEDQ